MQKENIKQIIRELARKNFDLYPNCYEIKNGLSTDEATENAQDLAINYYDNRSEEEVERDESAGVNKIEYVDFVMLEFEVYVQEKAETNQ